MNKQKSGNMSIQSSSIILNFVASSLILAPPSPVTLICGFLNLRGGSKLEDVVSSSNGRLPFDVILRVDLCGHWPILETFQSGGADDVFGACGGLVVVDMGCAVGAEIAVYGVSCVVLFSWRNFKVYYSSFEGGWRVAWPFGAESVARKLLGGGKRHTGITGIGIGAQSALGEFKILLGNNLVESVVAAVDQLARVAVAVFGDV